MTRQPVDRAVFLPVVASLVLLPVLACGGETRSTGDDVEAPAVAVTTAVAEPTEVTEPLVAAGGVEPLLRVSPGSKILGRVTEVRVEEGDRVTRGQLLARVEDRDLRAAVQQAEAELEMARARSANAAAQHRRMIDLHARGSVTEKNLEDAVAAYRVAEAAVAQAEAAVAAARVQLGYSSIVSPIDGWVVARRVEAGDMATPGTPFFLLEDLSQVEVEVAVGEETVPRLSPGDPASVSIGAISGELAAEIFRIVPAGDPDSRTFSVRLRIDNSDGRLRSGMFARATFAGAAESVLLVPEEALVRRGQLEGLYVVEEGRARLRWVRRGRTFAGRVEIASGLEPGERFVSQTPPPGLGDGSRVEEAG